MRSKKRASSFANMDDASIAAETASETAPNALVSGSAIPADELARLTDDIVSALKTVYDPEIPADIYELGLIYKIDIEDDRMVKIDMTLTAPGCPVAGEMPGWVENAVGEGVPSRGVSGVEVCGVVLRRRCGHDLRSAAMAYQYRVAETALCRKSRQQPRLSSGRVVGSTVLMKTSYHLVRAYQV
jgi:metal-sulfur cluster biosynthetic enzyme